MFLVPGLLPIKKNFLGTLPLFALDESFAWCASAGFFWLKHCFSFTTLPCHVRKLFIIWSLDVEVNDFYHLVARLLDL